MIYSFDNGAIRLDRENNKYVIFIEGEKKKRALSEDQLCNPLIAINEFTSEVNDYLRKKAKAYLTDCNENSLMGCTVEGLSCVRCRKKHLNKAGTRCPFL